MSSQLEFALAELAACRRVALGRARPGDDAHVLRLAEALGLELSSAARRREPEALRPLAKAVLEVLE